MYVSLCIFALLINKHKFLFRYKNFFKTSIYRFHDALERFDTVLKNIAGEIVQKQYGPFIPFRKAAVEPTESNVSHSVNCPGY